MADGHWEITDCKHTINGRPVSSVSCGRADRQIGPAALGAQTWHALGLLQRATPSLAHVYIATNMNCSDGRVGEIRTVLAKRRVQLICEQGQLLHFSDGDNFVASLVEQELCAGAHAFIGSKYSTWTDTVRGVRAREGRSATTFSFEDLWASGITS
mgnify:CR=1 FL=1